MDFNIGYNFDSNLPSLLAELNKNHVYTGNRIASVYGSDREHAWVSARPDFRIQDVSEEQLAWHVAELKKYNIEFNYTFNTPTFGSKKDFIARHAEIADWLHKLEKMGVARVIIADPMLIDFMARKLPKLKLKIELSTIMHVDTPMQLIAYKQLDSRIDRVVGNILYNRSFDKLAAFANAAEKCGMTYEIMTNEFCSTISNEDGIANMGHCIYRDSCYECHATNVTKKDALASRNYPMGNCMSGRASNAADWLRSNFVLPQHLHYYTEVGVNNFKITGRTAKTPYLLEMAAAHLAEHYDGNLMRMWKPLETIYSDKDEVSEHKYKFDIPTSEMEEFLHPWLAERVDCTTDLCSDCNYCDNFYKNMMPLQDV